MFAGWTAAPTVTAGVAFGMASHWSGCAAGTDGAKTVMPESMTANAISMPIKPRNAGIALAVMPSAASVFRSRQIA